MGLALNTNVASLNAQHSINSTNSALSKSLERLSTGLKINRGADGPAALVISEQQRAQISGLRTAIDNTNKAVSMVQTAEGALNEINRLLGKVRGLALDSANSGVNDSTALAANQAEIDNALDTISRISNTTKFGASKFLLNGQAGVTATVNGANSSNLGQIKADISVTAGTLQPVKVGGASGGQVVGTANMADAAAVAGDKITITGGGLAGSGVAVTLTGVTTAAGAVTAIQGALDTVGGTGAFTVTGGAGSALTIVSNISGTAVAYNVTDAVGGAAGANTTTLIGSNSGTSTGGAAVSNLNVTNGLATGGTAVGAAAMGVGVLGTAGTLTIGGGGLGQSLQVGLVAGDTAATVVQKVQAALDGASAIGGGAGKFTVSGGPGSQLVIRSNALGSAAMTVQADSAGTTTVTGVSNAAADTGATGNALVAYVNGQATSVAAGTQGLGNAVSFGGSGGLSFNVGVSGGKATSGTTNIDVVDNSLTFQIGANASETAKVSIEKMTADRLGSGVSGLANAATTDLSKIKVTTANDSQDAIKVIDQAISDVSSLRGKLGAFQANTLESNANNLRATLENTTAAESVIRDTDFASEIANFTKLQTQMQAGATVLGNANQLTTLVAGLLRA